MGSPVYRRAVRSLFKRSTRRGKGTDIDSVISRSSTENTIAETKQRAAKSRHIDELLQQDAMNKKDHAKVLMMGGSSATRDTFVKQMRMCYPNKYSLRELQGYRDEVISTLCDTVRSLLQHLIELGWDVDNYMETGLVQAIFERPSRSYHLSPEIVVGIEELWHRLQISRYGKEQVQLAY